MKVFLKNCELNNVVAAVQNTRRSSEGCRLSIRLKLTKSIDEIARPARQYDRIRPELLERHVAKDKNGNYKTKTENGDTVLVCKSDEDEEEFNRVADDMNELRIKLLTIEELDELSTTTDRYGTAEMHFQNLLLITEGEARTELPEDEQEPKPEKED